MVVFSDRWAPEWGYTASFGVLRPEDLPPFNTDDWSHRQNEQKYGFMSRLRDSVRREGFRNPILVFRGDGNDRIPYGQSRATIAKQLGIAVPAIVCDWTGASVGEPLRTLADVRSHFLDQPTVVEFTSAGLNIWGCRQVQLEDEAADFFHESQIKRDRDRERRGRGIPLKLQAGGPHGSKEL